MIITSKSRVGVQLEGREEMIITSKLRVGVFFENFPKKYSFPIFERMVSGK